MGWGGGGNERSFQEGFAGVLGYRKGGLICFVNSI